MHQKEQVLGRLWLLKNLQTTTMVLWVRAWSIYSFGLPSSKDGFQKEHLLVTHNPNSNGVVWNYHFSPSPLTFRELFLATFCFSSSFSPLNSGVFSQNWFSTTLLLSIAFSSFHILRQHCNLSPHWPGRGTGIGANLKACLHCKPFPTGLGYCAGPRQSPIPPSQGNSDLSDPILLFS